ncbi:MAG TPA: SDR family oxidoreductase [Candidatus Acidoferrales bacterium]|jgi:NAD(P)-dependent dehydrogenase (short-subunit alcohol dehydrogenase family)|nr:SDR family oxidoreductase [Candidatus Acidoferrales bacterium]
MPKNRTVLLTGGSRGIGAAIAAELTAHGNRVIAPTRAELDLGDPVSIDAFLARHRELPVDVLVNNAGINFLRSVSELDTATWQAMLQTNLTAALRLIQAYAPGMAARNWGRILNISTIFSLVTRERRAAYSMTKAALNALTRSTAVEFGPSGVLANALAPGYVDTALTRQNNSPEAIAAITSSIPLRRMAQAGELAKVAAFLVSEDNTYITGQAVVMDGGFTCL